MGAPPYSSARYYFPKPYADFVQRLRVASGFVLLVAFGWLTNPSTQSLLAGVAISLAGLALRAWAAGHLAKNQQLAATGPYALVRNPLYLGTLLVALGITVSCRSWTLAALSAAVFLLVYLPVIELEEQRLREIFPSYEDYAQRVHRLLPLRKAGPLSGFSAALYRRNREYKAALGFLVAFVWMLCRWWYAAFIHRP